MRILIPTTKVNGKSCINASLGQAPKLTIINTGWNTRMAIPNEAKDNEEQAASMEVAAFARSHFVDCVVVDHCTSSAMRQMKAFGIRVFTGVQGSISDALEYVKREYAIDPS